ncbi:MAG: hypothetical protein ABMA13_16385 [Chthoniobacteraceae bacterium]
MHSAPDSSWSHLAQFIRQHTHDVRNDLNGLDLEAALLADLVPDGEGKESVGRMRAQIRRVAADLHALAAKFADPRPTLALYAAGELFLIWQDQLSALDPAPTVQWSDALGAEQVNVDAAALANVFRELLANAQVFGTGAPLRAAARVEDGQVVFELREPKDAAVETASWGRAPFASMRHGHYGLGLWEAQRVIAANGGAVERRFAPDAMELSTRLRFPVA